MIPFRCTYTPPKKYRVPVPGEPSPGTGTFFVFMASFLHRNGTKLHRNGTVSGAVSHGSYGENFYAFITKALPSTARMVAKMPLRWSYSCWISSDR